MVTAPILDVAPITPRTRLLTIDISRAPMPFTAGQAVLVGSHGRGERHPYSIACSPEAAAEGSRLELLIGLEGRGQLPRELYDAMPGALVDLDGPLGTFTFPERPEQRRLLFVAGGTGIAPLRSMIDHALRCCAGAAISLLYSVRRGDEFAFMDELAEHDRAGRLELHPTVSREDATDGWTGGRGRIGRAHFARVLHDPGATLCFVCGPPTMVSDSIATLNGMGVPARQIRTEDWVR
ncbi:MAG TPA: FAD-dependent oxidoreductase [Vicinamibacterales bacterium]|jgi:NAD(P)H-flavin reductase|nr:FAD-dependent oxidoreductase [Vicinamibacterales bacterium]